MAVVMTCGVLSVSVTSIPSSNGVESSWTWAGPPLTWSKSNSKLYEPEQNVSVLFHVKVNWFAAFVKASMPLVGTPSANNVVRPAAQVLGRGPTATSVFAVCVVTGLPALLEASVSVHVTWTELPCTAFAGDEKFDTTEQPVSSC